MGIFKSNAIRKNSEWHYFCRFRKISSMLKCNTGCMSLGSISVKGSITNKRLCINGWGMERSGVSITRLSYSKMSISMGRSLYCPLIDFFILPKSLSMDWVTDSTSEGESEVQTLQTAFKKEFWESNPHGSVI